MHNHTRHNKQYLCLYKMSMGRTENRKQNAVGIVMSDMQTRFSFERVLSNDWVERICKKKKKNTNIGLNLYFKFSSFI